MLNSKIRVAFVKFGGLAAGGTEKGLQTIAANLPKEDFEVEYLYCDAAPYIGSDFQHPDTDPDRKRYMENKGVKLTKFGVGYKDIRNPQHTWVDTDFWERFDSSKYDVLVTARAGHPEYPFSLITDIPEIDLVTLPGMAERKDNVYSTVHISEFQANTWIQVGGDPTKYEVIPLFDELPENPKDYTDDLRWELGIEETMTVFGFHQREDDGIFSEIPLQAYERIQSDSTVFVLMGGSKKYQELADFLGLKHFHKIEHSGNPERIHAFLNTLDVYSHGRKDGETYSMAIAEAMYHGLPIVSHVAPAMGHKETMGSAGFMADGADGYAAYLKRIVTDDDCYQEMSEAAFDRYAKELALKPNIQKWSKLIKEAVQGSEEDALEDEDFWENMWA